MSDIRFNCVICKQPLSAPDDMGGSKINCPSCNGILQIPVNDEPMNQSSENRKSRRPFSWLPAVIIVMLGVYWLLRHLLLSDSVLTASPANTSTTRSFTADAPMSNSVKPASYQQIDALKMILEKGYSLDSDVYALKCGSLSDLWYVAATIRGPSSKESEPGIWCMYGDESRPGPVFALSDRENVFSGVPVISQTKAILPIRMDAEVKALKEHIEHTAR